MEGAKRTFVGFGFGAIQAGLFLYEAHRSGNFGRKVVAEVMPDVVDAVRRAGGTYRLNVAMPNGIEAHEITGVEIYNPREATGRAALAEAIAEASELATALPSVKFYGNGSEGDVAWLLAEGIRRKEADPSLPAAVIYTAENHNHAAEILSETLERLSARSARVQALNTVIGKMSGVVTDAGQIREQALAPVTPGAMRAFLVEAFNRILITKIELPGFVRGIEVFEEKPDLLPFEEAKLYGHNATHALIGYLLQARGAAYMSDVRDDPDLLRLAREAFLMESGAALCRKHAGVDPLFTIAGYTAYVDDLLERMANPHLRDTVERITRDPRRKLGWDDRLIGTIRVILGQGIEPSRYGKGAAAALRLLEKEEGRAGVELLDELWSEAKATAAEKDEVRKRVLRE